MDIVELMLVDGKRYASFTMEKWIEKSKYLLALCQDNDITIQRYYWKAIQDQTVLELFQPNIVDAYQMVIDVYGSPEKIQFIIDEYKKVAANLGRLQYIEPLTEKEIVGYAMKALTH